MNRLKRTDMKTIPLNRFMAAMLKFSRLSVVIKWFNK